MDILERGLRSTTMSIIVSEVIPGAIYRSAQPVTADDWAAVERAKIDTIVKLNYEDEGSDDYAAALKINVIKIPMPPRDLVQSFELPDEADMMRAVAALCDDTKGRRLGHCLHGEDRTGSAMGRVRVLKQNWTCHRAFAEMLLYGFHWELPVLMNGWIEFAVKHGNIR